MCPAINFVCLFEIRCPFPPTLPLFPSWGGGGEIPLPSQICEPCGEGRMESEAGEMAKELCGEQSDLFKPCWCKEDFYPPWQIAVGRGEKGSFHQSFGRPGLHPWLCH